MKLFISWQLETHRTRVMFCFLILGYLIIIFSIIWTVMTFRSDAFSLAEANIRSRLINGKWIAWEVERCPVISMCEKDRKPAPPPTHTAFFLFSLLFMVHTVSPKRVWKQTGLLDDWQGSGPLICVFYFLERNHMISKSSLINPRTPWLGEELSVQGRQVRLLTYILT